jgi:hypothetical protein
VVLAHLQREGVGVDLDQFGVEKEKKRANLGGPRVGKCTRTCGQRAALSGGGIALSGVHRTPQGGGTATLGKVHCHPLQCANFSTATLSYFGHNS